MRVLARVGVSLCVACVWPDSAQAAPEVVALPVADLLGLGKAIVGGLEFTLDFFQDLFLALFGGLADMLVPDSWAKKGTELLTWIAAVPNYTRPAFGDLRVLSQTSLWIGLATLPVTLSVALFLPSLGLTSSCSMTRPAVTGARCQLRRLRPPWRTIASGPPGLSPRRRAMSVDDRASAVASLWPVWS